MYRKKMRQLRGYFVVFLFGQINVSLAANWDITPAISVAQHYTDNLFLTRDEYKKEDYVTEINPAITIAAKGRRLDLDLGYVMQNLFYQYSSEYNDTNNLLKLNANTELVKDNLFFEVAGKIDQQILSFDQSTPVDNINIGNRTEVKALSISPYFLSDTAGYMSTDIRYLHGITLVEKGASDSVTNSTRVTLASGREFTRFTWRVSYNNIDEERRDANTIKFENALAEARYRLFNSLSFLANYGYANNDYRTTQIVHNGSYWAFGFGWRPNDKFGIDAVYGSEYRSATINWEPTPRTSLNANWRDTDVGLNPGKIWSGEFALRTRRTQWTARYLEDTTTTQQIQVLPDSLNPSGGSGQGVEPQPISELGVTDEVFVRKRGQLSVDHKRVKSNFSLSYFNETRILQTSGVEQQINGGRGSWRWKVSGKTTVNFLLRADQRQLQLDQSPDDFRLAEASIEWLLKRPFSASATYRYSNLDSEDDTRTYSENRVILRLNAVFSRNESSQQSIIQRTNIK